MDSFVFADHASDQDRQQCLEAIQSYRDKDLGIEKGTQIYNKTSVVYDNVMNVAKYKGPEALVEVMVELFPTNRHQVKILDAASGTGLCGEAMYQAGFTNLDAVDVSEGMLAQAKKKNIYQKLICQYLGENKLGIEDRIYDAVTMSGETMKGDVGENLVPTAAFYELASIIKSGGVLVNVTRKENFEDFTDEKGKWKLESKKTIPEYLFDKEGLVIVYRIL